MKKNRLHGQASLQPWTSSATRFNAVVLRKLQKAITKDPEVDLISIIPTGYSVRLMGMKEQEGNKRAHHAEEQTSKCNMVSAVEDTRECTSQHVADDHSSSDLADSIGTTAVTFALSESVQTLLGVHTDGVKDLCSQSMSINLSKVIKASEIIWQSEACRGHAVVKCSSDIVLKIVPDPEDHTEYTSMQYLAQNAPAIPAPKPLGLLASNSTSYIFMSFVPGLTVDKIWSKLSGDQKTALRDQFSESLIKLRGLSVPDHVSLGGTCNEGCKDTRRHTRICRKPIDSCAEFEDFIFSSPHFGSFEYITQLRRLLRSHTAEIVFTHGDFRPENIVVQSDLHGNYTLSGIIDWEKSGFYPDYFESIKATSNMSSSNEEDWYLYLPWCASPTTYPVAWLVDRVWDVHVA
ncbi:MAG: hypothetical protein LQ343_007023 [Gyalolechia ehrenbergii]|nr:MAG: hypothetical protein LQ343_007023 [Gyalolechia ehrenbergii]